MHPSKAEYFEAIEYDYLKRHPYKGIGYLQGWLQETLFY